MAPFTITQLSDIAAAQASKYLAINDTVAKLEALSYEYSYSEVITVLPAVPAEGIAYLANTAFGSLASGNFLVYTKPPNSVSATLVGQIFKGVAGLKVGGYRLNAGANLWLPATDVTLYGTNLDNYKVGVYPLASITTTNYTGTGSIYVNATPTALPYVAAIGSHTITITPTAKFIRI